MRRGQPPAGRAGFTLIELLVVIAILALLAALIVGGIARVKESEQGRVNTQTLTKLQKALENQWKVTCDQARDDRRSYDTPTPNVQFKQIVELCGGRGEQGSVERAEALWMHMRLRSAMPHTFAEARTPVSITGKDRNGTTVGPVTIPASNTFSQVDPTKTTLSQDQQSAVLLYMILGQGARGANTSVDDSMQGAMTSIADGGTGTTYTAFKDAYGNPVIYRRFYQNAEMDAPPYVRAGLQITDPLDPVGRLKLWTPGGNLANNRTAAVTAVFSPAQPSNTATDFTGRNKMATAISAGSDGVLDLSGSTDDAFGYRVLRQGAKGD
jgi:prepilin-type N-terminal cleavage/methylation domain-containing protein